MYWVSHSYELAPKTFTCSYCGNYISSNRGYQCTTSSSHSNLEHSIYICSHCSHPTFFKHNSWQTPSSAYGNHVNHIDNKDIESLYLEARECLKVNAFTASVLCSRKLLMNIAVNKGAEENKSFQFYVEYLDTSGFIPPNGKAWVDHIRKKGNEATHEILPLDEDDAKDLIDFIEMLLVFIYEFPNRLNNRIKK